MTPTPRLPHLEALYGSMPTLALDTGSTIVVTGVNGLVGSHIANQLLKRGYNVRGVVRDAEKHQYLVEYFSEKHRYAKFELVSVPDMTVEGCYDDLVEGIGGFIQVASPMGDTLPVDEAIAVATKGAVNGLKACAKVPSCKRFVFTSSSIAATFPYPDEEMTIEVNSYNDEALKALREDPDKPGLYTYAAMKVETEKAMRRWMEENKPDFNLIFVLPNVNFGPVLMPEHQGYPSSINWAHLAWKGEHLEIFTTFACAQWYIHPVDCALVHVSALIYNDVGSERLFAFAEPWDYNKILSTWRKLYPERKFPKPIEGLGVDKMKVPNKRAEELLMWVKGAGWDSLEKGLKEMTESWA